MTTVSVAQVGHKKDRTYQVCVAFHSPRKVFTVKGVGKDFMLFDGEQLVHSFKTLTKCCDYIKASVTA
jgi:hypothetical protein